LIESGEPLQCWGHNKRSQHAICPRTACSRLDWPETRITL